MDPVWLALSLFRRHRYEECAAACTEILNTDPYDEQVGNTIANNNFCILRVLVTGLDSQDPSAD